MSHVFLFIVIIAVAGAAFVRAQTTAFVVDSARIQSTAPSSSSRRLHPIHAVRNTATRTRAGLAHLVYTSKVPLRARRTAPAFAAMPPASASLKATKTPSSKRTARWEAKEVLMSTLLP